MLIVKKNMKYWCV